MTADHPFDALTPFDPELTRSLSKASQKGGLTLSTDTVSDVVDTILLGYQQEIHFGAALAKAYQTLLAGGTPQAVTVFGREIRKVASRSAALGHHLAHVLPAVLLARDDSLLDTFQATLAVLLAKGEYLAKAPLEALSAIAAGDDDNGPAYLTLLQAVFDRPLSYNRCQYLGNLLPRAILKLQAPRRSVQTRQMTRLVTADLNLIEPFLEGLSRGLDLLSAEALNRFVTRGLALAGEDPHAARRFIALRSGRGQAACRSLQTAVTLDSLQARLNRYLQARTGQAGRVRPLSAIRRPQDASLKGRIQAGTTDGVHLYLPDAVDCFSSRAENTRLLYAMAKFEAGLLEFDTFAFDIERARDMGCLADLPSVPSTPSDETVSDLSTFSRQFDIPRLALGLLTLFEHARVCKKMAIAYPGLVRSALPLFQDAMRSRLASPPLNLLDVCYGVIALDLAMPPTIQKDLAAAALVNDLVGLFSAHDPLAMRVEHCAGLVTACYNRVRKSVANGADALIPWAPPYRLVLQPERLDAASREADQQADRLRARLDACGLKSYRGDLRQLMHRTAGHPTAEDLEQLVCRPPADTDDCAGEPMVGQVVRLPAEIIDPTALSGAIEDPDDVDRITWLKEWSALIGDYLHEHVRVRDRRIGGTDTAFYETILSRRDGLVSQIKTAFELLRPEGLGLLRPWVEGDDFDYRALLDVALDRKAGRLPSDRLYIKRVKQRRDVAVMLLVDLSRSTSNIVAGAHGSVLDVTKEAIVLFTQALEVVGDAYAVAGFSGTGRLGVDFFRIKDFDEPLSAGVKGTLGALTPQRSTRMGAAVRRAALELMTQESRVRLLLLIGDGFPNDTEYKGDYAVQDTRQAIAEARSRGIITQAITVNLPASPQLDDLYGPVRHTVISNVNELPDKLLRLYGTLTRA
jgi:fructose-specific component phosphotransferase system IIB-like protein